MLTYYKELKELTIKAKQLVKLYKIKINKISKIYRIFKQLSVVKNHKYYTSNFKSSASLKNTREKTNYI